MWRTALCCVLVSISGSAFALTPAEQRAAVEAVRDYALSYTNRLPNYTCTQITRQTIRPSGLMTALPKTTVVEEQLSFADRQEIRRITRVDGRAVSAGSGKEPVDMSHGEFGNLLDLIFEPATGADLHWTRVARLGGRMVDVLSYRVPQSHGYVLTEPRRMTQTAFEGSVYADAQTHAVLRIQMKCAMIPWDSQYQAVELTLDYKAARVAGREFILPSHFVLNYRTDEIAGASAGDYTSYRRFSADTTIQFQ